MGRLLDEDAVFDVLTEYYYLRSEIHHKALREALSRVPSAQPEIIHCMDCDWWTKQDDSVQGRCALMGAYPTGWWFCGNARRRTDG